jgi:hypothetical protein
MSQVCTRVLAGSAEFAPPPGAIGALAWELANHARRVGLAVVRLRCSRIRGSHTKHIILRDDRNRHWHIRLSDHPPPRRTGHERPHFDLVSRDGTAGFELAIGFVGRVGRGEEAWAPAEMSPKRKGQR